MAKSSILKKGELLLQIITNIVTPSLIYILRTTSRYNINAPSSSKTKRLSAEAHLHTRYPKHCILVNDFTFQLKKKYFSIIYSLSLVPPHVVQTASIGTELFARFSATYSATRHPPFRKELEAIVLKIPVRPSSRSRWHPCLKSKKEKQNSHHRRRRRSLPSLRPGWHAIGGPHTSSTAQSKCTPVPMLPIRPLNSNPP